VVESRIFAEVVLAAVQSLAYYEIAREPRFLAYRTRRTIQPVPLSSGRWFGCSCWYVRYLRLVGLKDSEFVGRARLVPRHANKRNCTFAAIHPRPAEIIYLISSPLQAENTAEYRINPAPFCLFAYLTLALLPRIAITRST